MIEFSALIDLLTKRIKLETQEEEINFKSELLGAIADNIVVELKVEFAANKFGEKVDEVMNKKATPEATIQMLGKLIDALPDQEKVRDIQAKVFATTVYNTAQNLIANKLITKQDYEAYLLEYAEKVKTQDMAAIDSSQDQK